MNLKNLTIKELKEKCKSRKIKGYSKLTKNELIKILKKYKKGGSSDIPLINVYIYNIAISNVVTVPLQGLKKYYNETSKQKFNFDKKIKQKFDKFYINENKEGIIFPKSYNNTKDQTFVFNKEQIFNEGRVYTSDIITSIEKNHFSGGSLNNIKNFYNFYQYHKTKQLKFINNPQQQFYTPERIEEINDILKDTNYLMRITNEDTVQLKYNNANADVDITNKNIRMNGAYIYKINVQNTDKIIIFGDFHGSFHIFYRIFIRLHLLGAIDFINYRINDGYKLIFLGDILDRGQYALEILYIISRFILNNNQDKNNLKIILNRGNHEDPSWWDIETFQSSYGFTKELRYKLITKTNRNTIINAKNIQKINHSKTNNFKQFCNNKKINIIKYESCIDLITNFLSYCPSGIILDYTKTDGTKNKYWLSHGGIPINGFINRLTNAFNFIPKNNINVNNIPHILRWGDYAITQDDIIMDNIRPQIGNNILQDFLRDGDINFIIRGHNDDFENAYLLSDNNNNTKLINPMFYNAKFPLNNKKIYNLNQDNRNIADEAKKIIFPSEDSITINKKLTNIINKNSLEQNIILQTNGPICQIRTDKWIVSPDRSILMKDIIGDPLKYKINRKTAVIDERDTKIFPVLTISTNGDMARTLNNDSFIVLNFTNMPDFTNKNNQNNNFDGLFTNNLGIESLFS